jgi:hypothetical protein
VAVGVNVTVRDELTLAEGLLRLALVVMLYYAGTRGVLVLTRKYSGRWTRRVVVAFSFAVLFAPSIAGVGHGGLIPVPAWATAVDTAVRGRWLDFGTWGLLPILVTWVLFLALAWLGSLMFHNKNNNKVDTHGNQG